MTKHPPVCIDVHVRQNGTIDVYARDFKRGERRAHPRLRIKREVDWQAPLLAEIAAARTRAAVDMLAGRPNHDPLATTDEIQIWVFFPEKSPHPLLARERAWDRPPYLYRDGEILALLSPEEEAENRKVIAGYVDRARRYAEAAERDYAAARQTCIRVWADLGIASDMLTRRGDVRRRVRVTLDDGRVVPARLRGFAPGGRVILEHLSGGRLTLTTSVLPPEKKK